jgi:hypothetical protein
MFMGKELQHKSIEAGAAAFNVPNFVSMVQSTGAKHVIWSVTWWNYYGSSHIKRK